MDSSSIENDERDKRVETVARDKRDNSPKRDQTKQENYRDRSSLKEESAEQNSEQRGRTLKKSAKPKANDNSQEDLMELMGFGSFGSTKNKHVSGVGSATVKKNKKAEYRQYMNREKGFNRALSPEGQKKKKSSN